jgi:Zn-dependent protease with chaperone function
MTVIAGIPIAAGIPLVAGVLLALSAHRLGRWLPPATAARLLTVASLVIALTTGFVLAVAAFTVLTQIPQLAALAKLPIPRSGDAVPGVAGLLPAGTVLMLLAAAIRRAVAVGRDLAAAELTCRRMGAVPGGLVVVEADYADAYTVPGRSGRVVVSTGMLRALQPDERRVLLAHEASHLQHRHHAYIQLSDLAAAANPLLRRTTEAVHLAVERWADEDAADTVGDRAVAARALARAALARSTAPPSPVLTGVLGAVRSVVAERVRALLEPPPPPRRLLACVVATLVLISAGAAVVTARATELEFEHASALPAPAS